MDVLKKLGSFFVDQKPSKISIKILISFEDLEKISNFAKIHGCGSKIEPATPT